VAKQIHADNHFVPCVYLKGFGSAQGLLSVYRRFVPNDRVPAWRTHSLRAVAYHPHLYTRLIGGQERDEVERWLDTEFEQPAEIALQKALGDERMEPRDWTRLYRFVFAQYVRTPAWLFRNIPRWSRDVPPMLRAAMENAADRDEATPATAFASETSAAAFRVDLPFRLRVERDADQAEERIVAEIPLGRALWITAIKLLCEYTMPRLFSLRWTVLRPFGDLTWFTSDDPVVPFKRMQDGTVALDTGLGSPGTQVLLPLGPRHLLYTQVGCKPERRGHTLSAEETAVVRGLIARHASRTIFAASPDPQVPKLLPRLVNRDLLKSEQEFWRKWPEEQAALDRDFLSATPPENAGT
jgi:hypothetical protein